MIHRCMRTPWAWKFLHDTRKPFALAGAEGKGQARPQKGPMLLTHKALTFLRWVGGDASLTLRSVMTPTLKPATASVERVVESVDENARGSGRIGVAPTLRYRAA